MELEHVTWNELGFIVISFGGLMGMAIFVVFLWEFFFWGLKKWRGKK